VVQPQLEREYEINNNIKFPRHIQSGRNLQMAGASYCNHCGLAVADEFRDIHMEERHGGGSSRGRSGLLEEKDG